MGNGNDPLESRLVDGLSIASPAPPHALTQRHFVLQSDRPGHLDDIDLVEMDPFLRGLLFTDGTVTRTLEVQALSRISVDVIAQANTLASDSLAKLLGIPSGMKFVRRRVVIGTGQPTVPVIWAESHIVPNRLPPGFLGLLHDAPEGIGQSLQQVKLESWRDMLWFGLDSRPDWNCAHSQTAGSAITRLYRVITDGMPAMLISETIAVEQRAGTYHLDWNSG